MYCVCWTDNGASLICTQLHSFQLCFSYSCKSQPWFINAASGWTGRLGFIFTENQDPNKTPELPVRIFFLQWRVYSFRAHIPRPRPFIPPFAYGYHILLFYFPFCIQLFIPSLSLYIFPVVSPIGISRYFSLPRDSWLKL